MRPFSNRWSRRVLFTVCILVAGLLFGLLVYLVPRIEKAAPVVRQLENEEILWPKRSFPGIKTSAEGEPLVVERDDILTNGAKPDGSQNFLIKGTRESDSSVPAVFDTYYAVGEDFLKYTGFNPYSTRGKTRFPAPAGGFTEISTSNLRITYAQLNPAVPQTTKGTIVYLTSIALISPPEAKFLEGLRMRGWNTLAILPSDSLYRLALPLYKDPETAFELGTQFFTRQLDGHYAEQAAATSTLIEHISEKRPEIFEGKRVLMGASAGSYTLPAVAAQTGQWDAAIVIAGGTRLLEAMEKNSMGIMSALFAFTDSYQSSELAEIEEAGISAFSKNELVAMIAAAKDLTTLNAEALAPRLAAKTPVLMIAPSRENILPPNQPEELYEALNRPERWTYTATHGSLFYTLPTQVKRIDAWITETLADL